MLDDTTAYRLELADRLNQEASRVLPKNEAEIIHPFLAQYYSQIDGNEFKDTEFGDIYGAVVAHWQLARSRQPGTPLIHLYNPDYEKHGWQSTHTILEIVTDDLPFLVDSVSLVINRNSLTIHHTMHPVIRCIRDETGQITRVLNHDDPDEDCLVESYMQFHIDRETAAGALAELEKKITHALEDVALSCQDWKSMRTQVKLVANNLKSIHAKSHGVYGEAAELLEWIEDDHFTLLGFCNFQNDDKNTMQLNSGSILGLLRHDDLSQTDIIDRVLPCPMDKFLANSDPLILTKSNFRSTVHRPSLLDLICIQHRDKGGNPLKLSCILGLFTSAAYNRNTREIPHIRHKVARLLESSNLPAKGHLEKALQNVIEMYPRDTLFQTPEDELRPIMAGILHLQERQRIRMFMASEPFGRFHSVLVYMPKDRFHSDLRLKIQHLLADSLGGDHVDFNVLFSESVLARIHFLVYGCSADTEKIDVVALEQKIADAALSWNDHLRSTLIEQFGEEQGNQLFARYRNAFPGAYQEDFSSRRAAHDIQRINRAIDSGELGTYFYRPLHVVDGSVRLRLYSSGVEVSLSDVVPMIENMGLRVIGERPYTITPDQNTTVWIHEFSLAQADHSLGDINPEVSRESFESAFSQVWRGHLEDDGFNRLVLSAGLDWRECMVIRAYSKYLKQIRIRYSQDYIEDTLSGNPHMTQRLIQLFHAQFDPDLQGDRETVIDAIREKIRDGLERVINLDEDRILSACINAVDATLRTNYYQTRKDGSPKTYVSFKFDPAIILRMPEPRPMFEIFVYSPWVEAVHLRGGKVARGGLRWSDRPEDFRMEILGLVKAQMVKNAVIVPVGSKGGFIVKRMPEGDRETQMAEVVRCYQSFMKGMLDITDNVVSGKIVHPEQVVRHDPDDPYLVVAADKGTATFSDIANAVAKDYGFWLGDAFASGGSDGYDHKKMGITARGAWESVKRHFRELGVDTQSQPFTVVGIGDMGGDVFGNGMLLSRYIRLQAAFNHLHIVIDPDPDPEQSWQERKRLFDLPRSSWDDYNRDLLSEGGGIYSRSEKSITLSTQAQAALGINQETLTPTELIHHLLKAPVDLIWNGGIGTYVKSAQENHDQVSDRANDPLRVDGSELRCRVFGEGGNLGMTQLGRIEFSQKGGLCYTDAIDNSAGVDTSDHEVNIKILLDRCVEAGDLTAKQRNQLLASMTDEVADLVLRDNYEQTQAISITSASAPELLRQQARFIRALEREGELNRELEYLPDDETIAERLKDNQGFHRPELSVLFAYSKITLYKSLIATDVPEDPFLSFTLSRYFPGVLSERFSDVMGEHPLRREIIVTHITNDMVNRAGPTFAFRLWELTGVSWSHIARAYTVATEIFGLRKLWADIEALDNLVPDSVQKSMLVDSAGLVERATSWLLRNRPENMNISATVEYFKSGVEELRRSYPRSLAASNRLIHKRRVKQLSGNVKDEDLVQRVASLFALSSALDIVDVSQRLRCDVSLVANVYYGLGDELELHWLRDQVSYLSIRNHWQAMAVFSLRNELHNEQKELTALVLDHEQSGNGRNLLKKWLTTNEASANRFKQLIVDFKATREIDFAMLSVAISQIKGMHGAS